MKKIFPLQSKDYNCGYYDGYQDATEKVMTYASIVYEFFDLGSQEINKEKFVESFKKALEE